MLPNQLWEELYDIVSASLSCGHPWTSGSFSRTALMSSCTLRQHRKVKSTGLAATCRFKSWLDNIQASADHSGAPSSQGGCERWRSCAVKCSTQNYCSVSVAVRIITGTSFPIGPLPILTAQSEVLAHPPLRERQGGGPGRARVIPSGPGREDVCVLDVTWGHLYGCAWRPV